VQHEDHALGRAEPLQHHQQGQADAVVEGDPVGGVGQCAVRRRCDELDLGGVVRPFPAGTGRADPVQAQAAGHHDQPAALVLDAGHVRAEQAGERVLHGVLGGADVAEHPEREIDQVRAVVPVRLDDLRPVGCVAHSRSSLGRPGRGSAGPGERPPGGVRPGSSVTGPGPRR
jgi:hypothetical protein